MSQRPNDNWRRKFFEPARRMVCVGAALLTLSACNVWIAGHNKDFSLVMEGEGEIIVGTKFGRFTASFKPISLTCKGDTKIVYKSPMGPVGDRAELTATCSDGRTAKGELVTRDMAGGDGWAEDDCGNRLTFEWAIDEGRITEVRENNLFKFQKAKKPFLDRCEFQGDAPPHREPSI